MLMGYFLAPAVWVAIAKSALQATKVSISMEMGLMDELGIVRIFRMSYLGGGTRLYQRLEKQQISPPYYISWWEYFHLR